METINDNIEDIDKIDVISDTDNEIIDDLDTPKKENSIFDAVIDVENDNDNDDIDLISSDDAELIDNNNEIVTEAKEDNKDVISQNIDTETKNQDISIKDNPSYQVILEYGEDITDKEYITNPAIGREKEMQELIVILLTPEKSGILVGKPGIGKTAIVEGLSYKIQNNQVPDALKDYTIFKLNSASLTGIIPDTQELKIQRVVDNLKNLDKVMVFIDEIHTLIGNGENTLDFANIFKPVIDRGTIKIIGATTSDEYDRYILKDKAFVRRFQRVEVKEPTREETIAICMGTLPKIEKKTGATLMYDPYVKEKIMAFLTDLTSEYRRVYETGARYPDVTLAILQQAFSFALYNNRKDVNIFDVKKAILNTKNVYSDVIKKEIPRFEKEFKQEIEDGIDRGLDNA